MAERKTVMRAVSRVRRAWTNHVRNVALAEGIPESYRQVIMYLYHHPGSRQSSIAEFAGITTSAINQTVKSMMGEEYLRKESDPSDRRNSKLYLTEKGEATAIRLHGRLNASDDAITALIGPDKEQELIDILDKIRDYIRKELG